MSTLEPLTGGQPERMIYCVDMTIFGDSTGRSVTGLEVVPPLNPNASEQLRQCLIGAFPFISAFAREATVIDGTESTIFIASGINDHYRPVRPFDLGMALRWLMSPASVANIHVVDGPAKVEPSSIKR